MEVLKKGKDKIAQNGRSAGGQPGQSSTADTFTIMEYKPRGAKTVNRMYWSARCCVRYRRIESEAHAELHGLHEVRHGRRCNGCVCIVCNRESKNFRYVVALIPATDNRPGGMPIRGRCRDDDERTDG